MNRSPREIEQRQMRLYEFSKTRGFQDLMDCISEVVARYTSDLPRTPEQEVQWETYSRVSYTANAIVGHLKEEISAGAELSQLELAGEKTDAEEDRSDGDGRPRA